MIVHTLQAALAIRKKLDAENTPLSTLPIKEPYCSVRATTLSLAKSIERLGLIAHRAREFLVLSLGAFSALDCTVIEIIAQLKMMLQVHKLLIRIHGC